MDNDKNNHLNNIDKSIDKLSSDMEQNFVEHKEMRHDIKESSNEVDEVRELHRTFASSQERYFLGITPEQHLKDHEAIEELTKQKKEENKNKTYLLYYGITTLIISMFIGVGTWFMNSIVYQYQQKSISVLEEIKKELKINKN